jgi:CubicO group peptidase (beta-lactamase class C family)
LSSLLFCAALPGIPKSAAARRRPKSGPVILSDSFLIRGFGLKCDMPAKQPARLRRHLSTGCLFAATLALLGALTLAGCATPPVRAVRRVEFIRTLFRNRDHVADFRNMKAFFPSVRVPTAGSPSALTQGSPVDLPASFDFRGARIDTTSFLALTDTTGLIVIKDDKIVFEHYFRGTDAHTRTIAWSVSKAFVSALVGIAVGEGKIHSVGDPVTQYVPELAGSGYDGVRIKDVLQMSSGARWNEDYSDPRSDVVRFGHAVAFGQSLNAFAATLPREHAPGTYLRYNSMDTQVLSMVLRRATGTSLANYLATRLWQPLGMQDDAYFLTDRNGVEFAAGGLNATLRDYARLGLLYAHYGNWHGVQIVPAEWVRASITPDAPQLMPGRRASSTEIWGYGYHWWIPDLRGDYVAVGIFNQFIYVDPRERLVIVKSSANHAYGTGHGYDETKDLESTHLALFKAIGMALSDGHH